MSALAKELGISSKEALAKLNEIGEYVKSASSTVEAPVARRLRDAIGDRPAATLPRAASRRTAAVAPTVTSTATEVSTADFGAIRNRMQDPFDPLYSVPKARPKGPYKGDAPTGLKRILLDEYILQKAIWGRRPRGDCKYWASEVAEAEALVLEWADALLAGMSERDVMRWISVLSAANSSEAAALFVRGIDPDELDFDMRFDVGRPTIPTRIAVGNITVDQVVAEVHRRRAVPATERSS